MEPLQSEQIANFIGVTGATEPTAKFFLESAQGESVPASRSIMPLLLPNLGCPPEAF